MKYEFRPIFFNFYKHKGIDFYLEFRIRHKCTGAYGLYIYFGLCVVYRIVLITSLIGDFTFKKLK